MLRLHNTLSGRTEEFAPLRPGEVRLYTCGPTVWNHAHVGNFRAFLFYDLLRRQLEVDGLRVIHVMNLTDVDDRIISQAAGAGQDIAEYTRPFAEGFLADLASLRARPAGSYPRATAHVPEMVDLIERLLDGGHAYRADDGVYFSVASFPAYGALSRLDRHGLRPTGRVATDKYEKEAATDFALWKRAAEVDERVGAAWDAPFGRGRPGWHIECSAMSMAALGETLDIHAGGVDLMFPHHENEIAQSEAATGRRFANFWLHSEHLADATGATMSKSTGNIATLRDLRAAGHDPAAVRLFLLGGAHYRARLRLREESLEAAAEQIRRLRDFAARLDRWQPREVDDADLVASVRTRRAGYRAALEDDLNLPRGLGELFELVREGNSALDAGRVGAAGLVELGAGLDDADAHLDVIRVPDAVLEAEVEELIAERERARAERDFARADAIREGLRVRGVVLEDSRDGVRWRRSRPGTVGA